jgi:hypothetical protein
MRLRQDGFFLVLRRLSFVLGIAGERGDAHLDLYAGRGINYISILDLWCRESKSKH